MMNRRLPTLLLSVAGAAAASAHPSHGWDTPDEWGYFENPILTNYRQLTFAEDYTRAGEAYFSPDAGRIIFQATEQPAEGERASPHYQMFVAPIEYAEDGSVAGLGGHVRVSEPGSANTCGWFHPTQPNTILFGSTIVEPVEANQPGYQRESGRYRWSFPTEMDMQQAVLSPSTGGVIATSVMFERPGYVAEGSWSPDGRHVLYARINQERSRELGRPDADLYIYDQQAKLIAATRPRPEGQEDRYVPEPERDPHLPLVVADGYDGGPFFGPPDEDGLARWICYRSDRKGDNLLQLFIAELAYDDSADPRRVTGIAREVQITNNGHVNWAPYWHPSGRMLVYSTSEMSHRNYEVFAVGLFDEDGELIENAVPRRLTHAAGFDGLPVFSPDGSRLMWTAQRGGDTGPRGTPTSQLWIADIDEAALFKHVFSPPRSPAEIEADIRKRAKIRGLDISPETENAGGEGGRPGGSR